MCLSQDLANIYSACAKASSKTDTLGAFRYLEANFTIIKGRKRRGGGLSEYLTEKTLHSHHLNKTNWICLSWPYLNRGPLTFGFYC